MVLHVMLGSAQVGNAMILNAIPYSYNAILCYDVLFAFLYLAVECNANSSQSATPGLSENQHELR